MRKCKALKCVHFDANPGNTPETIKFIHQRLHSRDPELNIVNFIPCPPLNNKSKELTPEQMRETLRIK